MALSRFLLTFSFILTNQQCTMCFSAEKSSSDFGGSEGASPLSHRGAESLCSVHTEKDLLLALFPLLAPREGVQLPVALGSPSTISPLRDFPKMFPVYQYLGPGKPKTTPPGSCSRLATASSFLFTVKLLGGLPSLPQLPLLLPVTPTPPNQAALATVTSVLAALKCGQLPLT